MTREKIIILLRGLPLSFYRRNQKWLRPALDFSLRLPWMRQILLDVIYKPGLSERVNVKGGRQRLFFILWPIRCKNNEWVLRNLQKGSIEFRIRALELWFESRYKVASQEEIFNVFPTLFEASIASPKAQEVDGRFVELGMAIETKTLYPLELNLAQLLDRVASPKARESLKHRLLLHYLKETNWREAAQILKVVNLSSSTLLSASILMKTAFPKFANNIDLDLTELDALMSAIDESKIHDDLHPVIAKILWSYWKTGESSRDSFQQIKYLELEKKDLKTLNLFAKLVGGQTLQGLNKLMETTGTKAHFKSVSTAGFQKTNVALKYKPLKTFEETKRKNRISLIKGLGTLSRTVLPKNFNGEVIALGTLGCMNSLSHAAPLLRVGAVNGSAIVPIFNTEFFNSLPKGAPEQLVDLQGIWEKCLAQSNEKLANDWELDIPNRKYVCTDIDFGVGFDERLMIHDSIRMADYHKLDSVKLERLLKPYLAASDAALSAAKILIDFSARHDVAIRLIIGNSHLVPYSIFRDYIARNTGNVEVVGISVGYENYYKNFGSPFSSTTAVLNFNRNKNVRAPFLGPTKLLEDVAREAEMDTLSGQNASEEISRLTQLNRGSNDEQANIPFEIIEAAKRGRPVISFIGKILVDSAVRVPGGPLHASITEAIRDFYQMAENFPGHLFVFKPHPHEQRLEIAKGLRQTMRSLLPDNLRENVIFLDHAALSTLELARRSTLNVVWAGTSIIELLANGIRPVALSHTALLDYPLLEPVQPSTRTDLENLIRNAEIPKVSPKETRIAQKLLLHFGSEKVAIPNKYTKRPSTNFPVNRGVPVWRVHPRILRLMPPNKHDKLMYERLFT